MCGGIHAEDDPDYDAEQEESEIEKELAERHKGRYKRASGNTCQIIAVADTTFFNGPGGGFAHRTANSIIQSMQSVNNIYRNVMWNSDLKLTGLGFQIKELRIHQEHTERKEFANNGRHYNMLQEHWKDIALLQQFGRDKDFHLFCLAHLFTHRSFDGGVLGLAYIASSRRGTLGGICSTRRSGGRTLNTGFSSSMNTKGNNLLTQEAVLVTTHGHNWGAEHDAETSECAPSSFNNGKYVMYPYAVSGYEENNKVTCRLASMFQISNRGGHYRIEWLKDF
ncbi:disintegrin and metalloproteinase domain-containing protein 17 [Elysia marginata]|uniref:Disintegrin and metalloproteinase domain-containing protein 17 n=1 Tax=Elysia marginata TaxID=1093978 RepID=A0AAV4HRY4_9GAST|nr:disintegrin and metalloproteinase domain-containing protein 17 [Elysia marginata]